MDRGDAKKHPTDTTRVRVNKLKKVSTKTVLRFSTTHKKKKKHNTTRV